MKRLCYELIAMYIHINIMLTLSSKQLKNGKCPNDNFWKDRFDYRFDLEDFFSHLVETSYKVNTEKFKEEFCDHDRLLMGAKKLFKSIALIQYMENHQKHMKQNERFECVWSELIDHVFENYLYAYF